jgi:tetratricopeptide (TPR) repeat protein
MLLVQTLRLFPGEYFAERARTALRDENPVQAIAFADRALVYERANPNIFFYKGRALAALADREGGDSATALFGQAVEAFGTAHHLAPLDVTYSIDLAFTYDLVGRFREAEAIYHIARTQDPRSMSVAQLYGYHLAKWQNEAPHETLPASDARRQQP